MPAVSASTLEAPAPTAPPEQEPLPRAGRPAAAKQRPSVGESVVRGVLANLSTQPLTWGATLLGTVVVPRLLGSELLGQLTLAFSTTALAAAILDLGLVDYLTRRTAQHPDRARRELGLALVVQTVTFTLGALALAALAPFLVPSIHDLRILDLALVALVLGAAHSLSLAALRGREQHVHYAWLRAAPWAVGTVACVGCLVAGGDAVAFMVVAVIVDVAMLALALRVSGLRPRVSGTRTALLGEVRELIRGGLPFLSWNITMSVYNGIDRVLLGLFVPVSEVGWYGAAYRIIGIPVFIPTLLVTPLFPALSRSVHDPETLRRVMAQALKMTLLFTVPLSAGICVVAPAVPGLFGWPTDYASSAPLIMILSLQMPIVSVDMVLGTVIMAIGRERAWVRMGIIAAVLNVVLNLLAIPAFEHVAGNGPIGASIVTVLTEVWMCFAALMLLPTHLLDRGTLSYAARVVLAAAVAALVATPLMSVALVIAAVGGSLTYVLLAIALRVVAWSDVEYVRARVSRRRHQASAQPTPNSDLPGPDHLPEPASNVGG